MKNTLKQLLYTVLPYHLPPNINFQVGYIFHTEMVYDEKVWIKLLAFCHEYNMITGKRPICTVMAGNSPKVAAGMKEAKCSDQKLADRYHELSTLATLGYHGHFYLNPSLYSRYETEMRSNNFSKDNLKTQFYNDLNWFERFGINHNGIYAAGWWFITPYLISLLLDAGFSYDFSFSKHIYFRNQFSHRFMLENEINVGQPFEINIEGKGKIWEIQNLTGAPSSSLFQDFTRTLLTLLGKSSTDVTGVINSHDYDLDLENTLNLFRNLAVLPNFSFFDAPDLLNDTLKLNYKSTQLKKAIFTGSPGKTSLLNK